MKTSRSTKTQITADAPNHSATDKTRRSWQITPPPGVGLAAHLGCYESQTGAAEGTRTPDPIITNDVLYQLSYSGTFW